MRKLARRVDDSEFVKEYDIKEHKFMTMEEEKRQRVINSALKEFSKGYTAANTDDIVKEAGISKGLLFHYFGSKRGLFLFLIKYTLDIFFTEYDKVISESHDLLENICKQEATTMEYMGKTYTVRVRDFSEELVEGSEWLKAIDGLYTCSVNVTEY